MSSRMQVASEIQQIGEDVAQAVVGAGVIDKVEVRPGWSTSDEPTYEFFFRVDPARLTINSGLVHIHLSRHLLDALSERGDGHRPIVHLLDERDWNEWSNA